MKEEQKHIGNIFPDIEPDHQQWPIVKISKARKQVIAEVTESTLQAILKKHPAKADIQEVLAKAVYLEKARINGRVWSTDPKDDPQFWNSIKQGLVKAEREKETDITEETDLLKSIISRYAEEIAGHFDIRTYRFAQRLVPFVFNRLLNGSRSKEFIRLFGNQKGLLKRINLVGETEQVRELAKQGTVIMVPTHVSNIDSITIGWAISATGLPPFLYGAGLNLFSVKLLAFFMNRLGAYKVDRRKKNSVYLETLKQYSTNVICKGGHSLFFPGGTRSRSGELESHLKLGLLGTALEAQRINILSANGGDYKKIFVAPVTLNYSFVLEAPELIDEHLHNVGKERYFIQADKYSSSYKILKLLVKFFTASADFTIAFGKCMDIFGNEVNARGESIDNTGRKIDITDYFKSNGVLSDDTQRDSEYARMLSEKIVNAFHINNVAMAGHIVAFAAFHYLQNKHQNSDLYSVLRMPEEFRRIPAADLLHSVTVLQQEILKMEKNGKIRLGPISHGPASEFMHYGIKTLGIYHTKRPLIIDKKTGDIQCTDMKLLLYYHNHLVGYGLEKYVGE